ncbi:MAG: kynureninase [Candidatus Bathyarchaeota archaeon]|nr:MAG: kynureninase [Candidatus Bathyarchaeota archaeon]
MVTDKFEMGEDFAKRLDSADPLAGLRARFYIPDGSIYMDGNSLGLLSRASESSVLRVLDEWKTLGIQGWLEAKQPWFYLAEELGAKCAKLVGASPREVVATGTTTVNIHSIINTFYKPRSKRRRILADELTFPTDIYALGSIAKLRQPNARDILVLARSRDGRFLDEDDIVALMDENVCLALLPSVLYRSGQLLDMRYLAEEAHKRGVHIGFDCSHSVGVVPHYLDRWNVDFAVWCSYKYLNGGPGSTAFLYLNKEHFDLEPALAGWFGYVKNKQFDLSLEFEHARNAGGWQISSPAILSSAPLEGALEMLLEVGIESIRQKSLQLTSYLMYLIDELLSKHPYNFGVGTPREEERRGGHVAVEHREAMRISEALRIKGVISDFRPPNIIRIAPIPLYNRYDEVWQIIQGLKEIIDGKEYEKIPKQRKGIS